MDKWQKAIRPVALTDKIPFSVSVTSVKLAIRIDKHSEVNKMNYSEAFDKYAATHKIDSEGKRWFISGVDQDQITGDGGMLHFQVHPVDENGVVDYSVHHCKSLEYIYKLRPYRNTLKDAPESVTE